MPGQIVLQRCRVITYTTHIPLSKDSSVLTQVAEDIQLAWRFTTLLFVGELRNRLSESVVGDVNTINSLGSGTRVLLQIKYIRRRH